MDFGDSVVKGGTGPGVTAVDSSFCAATNELCDVHRLT